MNQRTKGFITVMISAAVFGLVPLFVRSINAGGSNLLSTAVFRFGLAIPALYLYLKIKKIPLAITWEELKRILLLSIVGYGGTAMLLFSSYSYIPSGMATTIHFVYPVFVILGSILFLHQKVRPLKIFCVGLCFAGILLFYNGGEGSVQLPGLILAFISGMTYSFYILYLRESSLSKMENMKLIFYMSIVTSGLVLIIALVSGQFVWRLPAQVWGIAITLALVASFVAVAFFQRGVRMIGAQNAAILSTLEPITSLLVGVIVYDEAFGPGGILGCICILTSVIIVARMDE